MTPHPDSISALIDRTFGAWTPPESPRPDSPAAPAALSVKLPEPRVSKQTFAAHVGMSVRWVEQKIAAGMPCEYIDGRPRLRLSEGDDWLRTNGHLTTTPAAGPSRG